MIIDGSRERPSTNSGVRAPSGIVETLERIRVMTALDERDWLELLGVTWKDYALVRAGVRPISDRSLVNLASRYDLDPSAVAGAKVNFRALGLQLSTGKNALSERHMKGAFGRRRNTAICFDYLEKAFGWRTRLDVLRRFQVTETALSDPFAPVSMLLMMDVCEYLQGRQFSDKEFFAMGAYNYEGNRDSIVGHMLSQLDSLVDLYDFFFTECMKLFERNCIYEISFLSRSRAVVKIRTNPDVAAEVGMPLLGNIPFCHFRAGLISTVPRYLGLQPALVKKTACEHNGDKCCRYDVDFSASITPRD